MVGNELQFVEWLRRSQRRTPGVNLGIGDDMAILDGPSGRVLFSSDMLLDGVHFDTKHHSWEQIGRKCLACVLSDCAAMAVQPIAATISLALPSDEPIERAQELITGARRLGDEVNVAIVGGDTNSWKNPLALDVAILACPHKGIEPVRRSGACAGDRIYVTGRLGGSLMGRHLTFQPRVVEAEKLARALGPRLHAMIDLSDGLALDLWRICQASSAGAIIDEPLLDAATSEDALRMTATDNRSSIDHVLSDGEDFELLCCIDGVALAQGMELFPVGSMTGSGYKIIRRDGTVEDLKPQGFVH